MIRQILRILWKQRYSYGGIFVEQLLVAVVLMLATVSVAEMVKKYKTPGDMNVDNTIYIGYMTTLDFPREEMAQVKQKMNAVLEQLRQLPFVEAISTSDNLIPYMRNDIFYQRRSDSVYVDDRQIFAVMKYSDEFGAVALKPEMEEGAWLENRALPDGSVPVVITRQLADKAGWTSGAGKKITLKGNVATVVGVAAGLRQEPFFPSPAAVVMPQYLIRASMMSESVARIKADREQEFIDAFNREFKRLVSDERVEPTISAIQTTKGTYVTFSIFGVAAQAIPTAFLFFFAFIGTFGLSWMVSQKRLKEFALRIALGSTKSRLMYIVIGESLLVTAIAVIPALLLSFFIYEYTAVHAIGVGVTILTMLLFSAVSAWYPAWKTSRVNPAEALQYE
jgi:ABC-type antimicrobial peptide transport system permease subunit